MSDPAGELTQRLDLLRLTQAIFHGAPMGGVGNDPHEAGWHAEVIKRSTAQVYPACFAAGTPADARLDVDIAGKFCLRKRLSYGRPIFIHDMLEGRLKIPEWLDFGIAENLVMPHGAMHRAGREVEFPTTHAGRLQRHLQELGGIDRPGFHKQL
ncbi:MAG TPA: hypothetical protein VGJ20_18700 [Xanthobacteraceae bacterium]